jgi:hypothetical protein
MTKIQKSERERLKNPSTHAVIALVILYLSGTNLLTFIKMGKVRIFARGFDDALFTYPEHPAWFIFALGVSSLGLIASLIMFYTVIFGKKAAENSN